MGNCYVFDIDGTICNIEHRVHYLENKVKDWDAFFAACVDDAPHPHIRRLVVDLTRITPIIYISGRSSQVYKETIKWLGIHEFPIPHALYMRKVGDHRPDTVVKLELFRKAQADGWKPIMIFEDRYRVVEMWRANGIPCAQVAEGKF